VPFSHFGDAASPARLAAKHTTVVVGLLGGSSFLPAAPRNRRLRAFWYGKGEFNGTEPGSRATRRPAGASGLQPSSRRLAASFLFGHVGIEPRYGTGTEGVEAQTGQGTGSTWDHIDRSRVIQGRLWSRRLSSTPTSRISRPINSVDGRHMPGPPPARSAPANVAFAARPLGSRLEALSRENEASDESAPVSPRQPSVRRRHTQLRLTTAPVIAPAASEAR